MVDENNMILPSSTNDKTLKIYKKKLEKKLKMYKNFEYELEIYKNFYNFESIFEFFCNFEFFFVILSFFQ